MVTLSAEHRAKISATLRNRPRAPYYVEEDRGHGTPCWVWQRALTPQGYPHLTVRTEGVTHSFRAHRLYYERYVGPIPQELELDHLCNVRACVNPDHLEAVTHAENIRRAIERRMALGLPRFSVGGRGEWHAAAYELWKAGKGYAEIGRELSQHRSTARRGVLAHAARVEAHPGFDSAREAA